MGSSSITRKMGLILVLNISLLQASLQFFFVLSSALSSADDCCGTNSVAPTVLESSSWLKRLGGDQQLYEGSSRRALFRTEDMVSDHIATVSLTQVSSPQTIITVNPNGTGHYATVQQAVDAVPDYNTQRVEIRIFSGIYREKIHIPTNKPFITFLGVGTAPPVLTSGDNATTSGSTWTSASVAVDAANFIAQGITFENTAPPPAPGAVGGQAVALRIGGDMAAFSNCSFLGAQDTLLDWAGRHYFQNCFIQGSIDFIFGNGQSLYEGCTINSIAQTTGCVTAQYRQSDEDSSGFSFVNCNIIGTGRVLLGRAWGPYSRVVFSKTNMANIIDPKGWNDFGSISNDRTAYYGEYNNFGEGATLTGRVSFSNELTAAEAQPFLTKAWIDGADWLPF